MDSYRRKCQCEKLLHNISTRTVPEEKRLSQAPMPYSVWNEGDKREYVFPEEQKPEDALWYRPHYRPHYPQPFAMTHDRILAIICEKN